MIWILRRIRVALIEIPALFGGHCNYTFDILITKIVCVGAIWNEKYKQLIFCFCGCINLNALLVTRGNNTKMRFLRVSLLVSVRVALTTAHAQCVPKNDR